MSRRSNCTIYVGNLPGDIRESEIEDLFYKYGPIVDIDLKLPPRPPGFCFVEFQDPRDAEDAIRGRDGYYFEGDYLRVELAHGGRSQQSSSDRYSSQSSGRYGVSRRADYRVVVTRLPHTASWQDLKDHMRKAGDVCFAQVFRERGGTTGIVDYTNYDDMKYAIRQLDDSEFTNRYSRAFIRVREYEGNYSRRSPSASRSPSRTPRNKYASRSRSRSKSPVRSHSRTPRPRSVSRSRSISKSKSYTPSRSPSRSRSVSASEPRSPSRSPPHKYSKSENSRGRSSSRSRSLSRSP